MRKKTLISYHESDGELVRRLDGDLLKRGMEVWIDTRSINPGQVKSQAIYEGIVSSDCFIACLSPRYFADELCRTQLFLARAYNKQILPVLVSAFSPGRSPLLDLLAAGQEHQHAIKGIEELDILDFSGQYPWGLGSYERNFEKLVDAIQPTPKPEPLNAELIYISYNYRETDFVLRLAKDLELARGRIWIDKLSIPAGGNWRVAMYEGLRTADHFVLCLTPEAARSENIRHEVLVAKIRGIPIYPVISERIHGDPHRKAELKAALAESADMKFLNDRQWFAPAPGYKELITGLKKAVGLARQDGRRKQGIFISYRRADSQAMTGRIHEKLVESFGAEAVFRDVVSIQAGDDFAEEYMDWLKSEAAVALIIIGEQWASLKDKKDKDGPPRLQKERDHVRLEVETALKLKEEGLRVIPVLVGDATMPKEPDLPETLRSLRRLQVSQIRYDPDFSGDMKKLIGALNKVGARQPAPRKRPG